MKTDGQYPQLCFSACVHVLSAYSNVRAMLTVKRGWYFVPASLPQGVSSPVDEHRLFDLNIADTQMWRSREMWLGQSLRTVLDSV